MSIWDAEVVGSYATMQVLFVEFYLEKLVTGANGARPVEVTQSVSEKG